MIYIVTLPENEKHLAGKIPANAIVIKSNYRRLQPSLYFPQSKFPEWYTDNGHTFSPPPGTV